MTNFTGTFICGFEVLCILLVLNFVNPKTFITVSSQLNLLVLNFAVWDTIAKKQKKLAPANNCNLTVCHGLAQY